MPESDHSERRISRRRLLAAAASVASTSLILPLLSTASENPMPSTPNGLKDGRPLDLDRFVEDCVAANAGDQAQHAVLDVLQRAVANPNSVLAAVGEPSRAGLNVLLRSSTLTIFCATWTPQMNLMPHNHLMWANIGIYTGREDNILWRDSGGGIAAYGAEALFSGDAAALPADVIHSVTNPLQRFTGGIHIYGGDFFATTRSQWDPESLEEEPSDGDVIRAIFARENKRLELS